MKDSIAHITKWILYAMLFIGLLAGVLFFTGGIGVSNLIYLGNIFFYIAVIVLVVAPVYAMINNPKSLGKMVASVGILIVIFGISYILAHNSMTPLELEKAQQTAETSRLIGMGLYAVYITLVLSVITILYSLIIKIIK